MLQRKVRRGLPIFDQVARGRRGRRGKKKIPTHYSLVILQLDLELIATGSPSAPNNYLSDTNQHIKSLPKSTRRKIVNLPEHFRLICIISKKLLVCVFWNVKKAQLKINAMK